MKKSDITYILCSAFMAFTSLFYCCAIWFSIKLPRYYPLEHTWKWIKEESVPSQGWYGMQVFAFLAAGIVTFIIYLVLKRIVSAQTSLKPAYIRILGVMVTLTVVICLGYTMYHEFEEWIF
jgi:hypothetical protein